MSMKSCFSVFFCLFLLIFFLPSAVWAESGVGAYVEKVSFSPGRTFTWYVPPKSELTIVSENDVVLKSVMDSGRGIIITALLLPEENTANIASFYSDSVGLSSRVVVDFSRADQPTLLPPTLYSIPNINDEQGSLGFMGMAYPLASINLEITLGSNEKLSFETLANSRGEWQIVPPKLPQGRHQAKARAVFQQLNSAWSQDVTITVLAAADQLISNLGTGTRRGVENVIENLPSPVKKAAVALDNQSEFGSKYLLPSLLTLSTLATTGVMAQNLIYLLFQGLIFLAQLFGLVRKIEPMGYIYDAVTKKPLGRAIVRLYEAESRRLVETDVTSATGAFSFMPEEGYYYLRASKPGYLFPTRLILSSRDGKFSPIYSGGEIRVGNGAEVIHLALPMDPEAYQETIGMRFAGFWQRWFEPMNQWLLVLGFFLSFLSYSRQPTRINIMILAFYAVGMLYFWSVRGRMRREFGLVVNETGRPTPGIELNLIDVEYNRLVSRRVSDEKGRYQFIVPPGKYTISMVTPAYELLKSTRRGCYGGETLLVQGERGTTKNVIPKIVVKRT